MGEFIAGFGIIFGLAVVSWGMVYSIIRSVLGHRERMAKLKTQASTDANRLLALEHDLIQLRSNTTDYDLSLQQLLERIEERLDKLEAKNKPSTAAYSSETTQTNPQQIKR
jgi:biopolymer transport protein ExbB/TolQ